MNLTLPSNTNSVSNLKILLAEDNLLNQQLALALLKKLGYSVDAVSNGREVLQSLQQQFYDVILMDVYMPEMCGITATKEIHQLYPASKRPYIIALTALVEKNDIDECINAGMQEHLNKPINGEALKLALQRVEQRISCIETQSTLSSNEAALLKPPVEVHTSQPSFDETIQNLPILDSRAIASIRKMAGMGAKALIEQLIESYLTEAPAMLDRIYQAIEARDSVALYKAAHALRSSSANLGAAHLAQICSWLEEQGRLGNSLVLHDYRLLLEDKYRLTKIELMAIG